ncbi:MAG: hypothetical protein EOO47_16365 [Flavobacterium sp.]|nr:MAG: hypothetical protein EOO47_16365 [Flavobacterium sp.]
MKEKEKAKTDIYKALRSSYPNNLLYEMPELLSKKLRSFMLIREDLSFIEKIAEQLIFSRQSSSSNSVIERALWQSIIITYGKCFTETKAGMSKLEKALFAKHGEKYESMHNHLMDIRHSYIAHRGETANEQAMVFIKVSKTGYMMDPDTEDIIISRKLASPRIGDLKMYVELFNLLLNEVQEKIQKQADKAHQAFLNTYTPKQAKALLVSKMESD